MTSPTSETSENEIWIADRFQLGKEIGVGGLSSVFSAYDHQLARPVAIKVIWPQLNDHSFLVQIWREAMTISALEHPNIVSIYDYGFEKDQAYIVMELLEGENLEQCLLRGPLHFDDFKRFAQQSLEGLSVTHQAGFVHRDLKPSNFMLARKEALPFLVKILDFGLAKYLQAPQPQSKDQENSLMGSIHYMAPEQFQNHPIDSRTDLYSLGCIFYEMITSYSAFEGHSVAALIHAHLSRWPVPIEKLREDIPPPWEEWILTFLAKDPTDRFENAQEAIESMPS